MTQRRTAEFKSFTLSPSVDTQDQSSAGLSSRAIKSRRCARRCARSFCHARIAALNKCSELCIDVAACPLCLEYAEATRLREAMVAQADRDRLVAIAQQLHDNVTASDVRRSCLSKDDSRLLQVTTDVQRAVQAAHGFNLEVISVDEIVSPLCEQRYFDAVKRMHGPSLVSTKLYHGTLLTKVDSIVKEGFKVSASRTGPRASHKLNMLGPAVYLCPDSSKAARDEYTGENGEGALLVCDVLLGSTKRVRDPQPSYGDDAQRKEGKYDSCFVARGTAAVVYDEYAVYDPALVLPRCAVLHYYSLTVDGLSNMNGLMQVCRPV